MTRRTAFTVAVQAIGGVAGAVVALPAIGFAVAPLFEEEETRWQPVGDESLFTEDTYASTVISAVEGIGEAGKTTAYVRRGSEDLKEDPTEFIAISTRCAHLGCPVRFVPAAGNFICPCHGGVYDFEGKVIGGPPVRPLDRFQTRVVDANGEVRDGAPLRGDRVEIGPRYSVTSQLEPVRARDPGEFTGGIWEYLYPPRPSVPPPP
jgi:Rieske Fe-S protein